MIRLTIIATILTILTLNVSAQYNRGKEFDSHYGMNVSQINSGSGHGHGISINTNIQKGRKSLEVGAIYQTWENKLAGADFRYKVFLGQFNEVIYRKKSFKPYFQYNLIYQVAVVDAPTIVTKAKSTIELPDDEPGFIGTMEHYAAFGMQVKLYNSFYVDSSLGFGAYIGSIDKEDEADTFGVHKNNHGFTASFKIGIGYRFN